MFQHAKRRLDHIMELAVGNQHLGLAMLQHECDGLGIEADVERVEHGADHRHTEMHFKHLGNVGQHHRHGVVLADTAPGQSRGQAPTTGIGLRPGAADRAVDDGGVVRVDVGGALDEAERRQGNVVDSRRA
ncbi:hypothetical protein D9M73_131070 [compost metagenome]